MSKPGRPSFNLWPIAAVALGLFGLVSYFVLFARFEGLRDTAALNLALVGAGVAAGVWGLLVARRKGGLGPVMGAGLACLLSLGCAGLLVAYVVVLSSSLPAPQQATLQLEQLPDLTLLDQQGRELSLASLRGKRVLLVFYRGYW